jgi:hypothetical protein
MSFRAGRGFAFAFAFDLPFPFPLPFPFAAAAGGEPRRSLRSAPERAEPCWNESLVRFLKLRAA